MKVLENKKSDKNVKNYIKLACLLLVTILFILVVRKIYSTSRFYNNQNSILHSIINEAKTKDIDNFLVENPDTIVYICSSDEKKCQDFDLKLKNFLKNNEYLTKNKMVYLNIIDAKDKENFLNSFSKNYGYTVTSYPIFVSFESGKLTGVVNDNDEEILLEKFEFYLDNTIKTHE